MTAKNIKKFLKSFKWDILCKMYGSAHSSIIGFISSSWIDQSVHNTVLDGVPSPSKGRRRKGQKNADIVLCKQEKPYVVVEVESWNYRDKINTIQEYMKSEKFSAYLECGLLVMTNVYGLRKGESCWDTIKDNIQKMKSNIALVFLEKREDKENLGTSAQDRLRRLDKNNYSSKTIVRIKYWVHTSNQDTKGTLYKNEK